MAPLEDQAALKSAYVRRLADLGSASAVCGEMNLRLSTVRNWRLDDREFDEACREAKLRYHGVLEKEAHRRAVEGVPQGVWHQGARVGQELVYSDRMLLAQLARHMPDKYGRQRLDLVATKKYEFPEIAKLAPEDAEALASVLERIALKQSTQGTPALSLVEDESVAGG